MISSFKSMLLHNENTQNNNGFPLFCNRSLIIIYYYSNRPNILPDFADYIITFLLLLILYMFMFMYMGTHGYMG